MDADKPSTEFIAAVVKTETKAQTPPHVLTHKPFVATEDVRGRWRQFLNTLARQKPIQRSTHPRLTDAEIGGVESLRQTIMGMFRVAMREQTPPQPTNTALVPLVAKWRETLESELAKVKTLDDVWDLVGEYDVCPTCYLPRTNQVRWHNYRDVPCACGPNNRQQRIVQRITKPPTR